MDRESDMGDEDMVMCRKKTTVKIHPSLIRSVIKESTCQDKA